MAKKKMLSYNFVSLSLYCQAKCTRCIQSVSVFNADAIPVFIFLPLSLVHSVSVALMTGSLFSLSDRWYTRVGIVMPASIGVRLKMIGESHEAETLRYK